MKFLGYIFATIIVIAVSAPINGYMISVLWGWFMVPIFHLPTIGVFQAVGLAYVAAAFTYQMPDKKEDASYGDQLIITVMTTLAKTGMFLFFGYIVKSIM